MSATECDVCWGTGFYKGYGVVCSRGCMPPGQKPKPAPPEERKELPEWMEDLPELKDGFTKATPIPPTPLTDMIRRWRKAHGVSEGGLRVRPSDIPVGRVIDPLDWADLTDITRRAAGGTLVDAEDDDSDSDAPDTCDKTLRDCREKHDNEERFGGVKVGFGLDSGIGPCPYVFRDSNCGLPDRTQFDPELTRLIIRVLIQRAIEKALGEGPVYWLRDDD